MVDSTLASLINGPILNASEPDIHFESSSSVLNQATNVSNAASPFEQTGHSRMVDTTLASSNATSLFVVEPTILKRQKELWINLIF